MDIYLYGYSISVTECSLCRPERSDPTSHPCPALAGRGNCLGTRPTLRAQPTRCLEAPQGTGDRRPHRDKPGCAAAAAPPECGPDERRRRLDRTVPDALGAPVRQSRPPFDRAQTGGEMTVSIQAQTAPEEGFTIDRIAHTLRFVRHLDAPREW